MSHREPQGFTRPAALPQVGCAQCLPYRRAVQRAAFALSCLRAGLRFQVRRHSGRRDDTWKVQFESQDLDEAEARYRAAYQDVRQGGLELVAGARLLRFYSVPLLRSRW